MSQPILSLSESSAITKTYSEERSPSLKVVGSFSVESATTTDGVCEVVVVGQLRRRAPELPNHVSIEDLEARLSKIPGMAEEVVAARDWVASTLYPGRATLRTLRLAAGLTQTMLATRIGTSQPHLARMENGQGNVMRETMHRLCAALRVDMNTLDEAMQASAIDA